MPIFPRLSPSGLFFSMRQLIKRNDSWVDRFGLFPERNNLPHLGAMKMRLSFSANLGICAGMETFDVG
jgi:hypothetical protein